MARTFYTDDYKDATVTMYMDNSLRDTAIEMGVSTVTVVSWYKQAVAQGGAQRPNKIGDAFFTLAQKHEACTYYSTHTGDQTLEKYGLSVASLTKWRKDLGYPNKHYGRNLKSDRSHNDVAILHAKAMAQVNQQKDAYRIRMDELENLAANLQNKILDFQQSLKDE